MDRTKETRGHVVITDRFAPRAEAAITAQHTNQTLAEKVSTDPALARVTVKVFQSTRTDDDIFVDTKFSTSRRSSGRLPGYGTR